MEVGDHDVRPMLTEKVGTMLSVDADHQPETAVAAGLNAGQGISLRCGLPLFRPYFRILQRIAATPMIP